MLLIKFNKIDSFAYNSYLDCRDVIVQTIKRAGIDVNYSQGFNPHELIYFSPPTSLGIESFCEYCYIVTDYQNPDNFKELFNKYSPAGLQVEFAKIIDKKPNFYDLYDFAEYQFIFSNKVKLNFADESFARKMNADFSNKIFSINANENIITCIMACGQKGNLKPSALVEYFSSFETFELDKIKKLKVFKLENQILVNIDSLL